jgi:hypothetical protein
VLAVFAAVAAVAPYGAIWIAAVGLIVARVIDRSSTALLVRRDHRGRRVSDGLVTVAALPWRLLRAIAVTALSLILPLLIGASVAFITASVWARAPGDPGPLAVGMVALLLSAWWGPGGGSIRRGTGKGLRFVARGRRGQIVVWFVLTLVLASALTVLSGSAQPDWGPLNGKKLVQMLSLS